MTISEFHYSLRKVEKGYNNRTLYINLTKNLIKSKPVTHYMKETFIGGRGFDLWLLWNALPKDRIIKWNDPENEICIASGPLGGTPIYPGSGKSIVVTISPLTASVIDSNVGGYFGPYLKFAGWDALEIQGKAMSDVIIFIDGDEGKVVIESAVGFPSETHILAEKLTEEYGREDKRSISVVSSGPGAEYARFGCLNFSWYDSVRKVVRYKQAGRGGIGTVFRNKKVKAIVTKFSNLSAKSNNPADFDLLKKIGLEYNKEIRTLDPKQHNMAVVGTTHLIDIMNDFNLLPVNNFKFGSHPKALQLGEQIYKKKFHPGFDGCWVGCTVACSHGIQDFQLKTGPYKGQRVFVNGPEYETIAGLGSNCGIFDPDYVIEMNFYCDTYGIDTISLGTATAFAMECYERGLINQSVTDDLELNFGNQDSAAALLHQMARGEGFGVIVGQGVRRMKRLFVEKYHADPKILHDIGMEVKGLEFSEYITKESLAQQGGYGLALKGAQHDEAWLIFLDMVHNLMPTFEQKAEALYWFPMFRTWFGLNGLCKLPWNDIIPEDNKHSPEPAKVMAHVEKYSMYFYAITGRRVTTDDLIAMSEKVYNFQRIFNLRMGFGTREHDDIPYRAMGPMTEEEYESNSKYYDNQLMEKFGFNPKGNTIKEKLKVLRKCREVEYEKLKDAVYKRRGWNQKGIPTIKKVKELELDLPDIVKIIKKN